MIHPWRANYSKEPRLPLLALDCETTGLFPSHGDRPFIVSWATEKESGKWEVPVDTATRKVVWPSSLLQEIRKKIEGHTLVFHNAKFDIKMLIALGINIVPVIQKQGFYDTLTISHLLRNDELHGLKTLAFKYLGIPETDEHFLHGCIVYIRDLIRRGKLKIPYLPHPVSDAAECDYFLAKYHPSESARVACGAYAVRDVIRTVGLLKFFEKVWDKETPEDQENFQKILWRELGLCLHLVDLERRPITYFAEEAEEYSLSLKKEVEQLDKQIIQIAKEQGVSIDNPNSDIQMSKLLYGPLALKPPRFTETGRPGCSAGDFEELLPNSTGTAREVLTCLLARSKATTRIGYCENYRTVCLPDLSTRTLRSTTRTSNRKICANLNQHGTTFTRLSASGPNLQNVGKPDEDDKAKDGYSLRSLFGPGPGELWYSIDYSQIEMRLFAVIAKAIRLQELFQTGGDIYKAIASLLYMKAIDEITKEERTSAKTVVLGTIYGLGEESVDLASYPGCYRDYTTKFFPEVGTEIELAISQVKVVGYVKTLSGYRLGIDRQRPYAGVNGKCQGSAGDIIKLAMVLIGDFLKSIKAYPSLRMALQIHDELIFIGSKQQRPLWEEKVLPTIRWIMNKAGEMYGAAVPTDIEIIENSWADPKECEIGEGCIFPQEIRELPSWKIFAKEGMLCG